MSSKKVWFITGAGRGMGVDFAKAALAAGHAVVASGRDRDAVSKALGLVGGAQAGRLRVPLADGTLVATPDVPSDDLIPSLLTLSDVMGTTRRFAGLPGRPRWSSRSSARRSRAQRLLSTRNGS
jgi:NAD(P)-dependent dehydrogenase (short-subunit alcohol dehydrogenase family)